MIFNAGNKAHQLQGEKTITVKHGETEEDAIKRSLAHIFRLADELNRQVGWEVKKRLEKGTKIVIDVIFGPHLATASAEA